MKRTRITKKDLEAVLERELSGRLEARLAQPVSMGNVLPVYLGEDQCNWLFDDRTLRKQLGFAERDVALEVVTDAMTKYALEATTRTAEPECWLYFFPGSAHRESLIVHMEPIEDYPSVEAAKAEFSQRINGSDPNYPNVDDEAFAYIFIKALQVRPPKSVLWRTNASINVIFEVGPREGNFRTLTMETGHDNERRLRPISGRS